MVTAKNESLTKVTAINETLIRASAVPQPDVPSIAYNVWTSQDGKLKLSNVKNVSRTRNDNVLFNIFPTGTNPAMINKPFVIERENKISSYPRKVTNLFELLSQSDKHKKNTIANIKFSNDFKNTSKVIMKPIKNTGTKSDPQIMSPSENFINEKFENYSSVLISPEMIKFYEKDESKDKLLEGLIDILQNKSLNFNKNKMNTKDHKIQVTLLNENGTSSDASETANMIVVISSQPTIINFNGLKNKNQDEIGMNKVLSVSTAVPTTTTTTTTRTRTFNDPQIISNMYFKGFIPQPVTTPTSQPIRADGIPTYFFNTPRPSRIVQNFQGVKKPFKHNDLNHFNQPKFIRKPPVDDFIDSEFGVGDDFYDFNEPPHFSNDMNLLQELDKIESFKKIHSQKQNDPMMQGSSNVEALALQGIYNANQMHFSRPSPLQIPKPQDNNENLLDQISNILETEMGQNHPIIEQNYMDKVSHIFKQDEEIKFLEEMLTDGSLPKESEIEILSDILAGYTVPEALMRFAMNPGSQTSIRQPASSAPLVNNANISPLAIVDRVKEADYIRRQTAIKSSNSNNLSNMQNCREEPSCAFALSVALAMGAIAPFAAPFVGRSMDQSNFSNIVKPDYDIMTRDDANKIIYAISNYATKKYGRSLSRKESFNKFVLPYLDYLSNKLYPKDKMSY